MRSEFGEFIDVQRKKRGVLLKDVADHMGCSPTYFSDIIKGRRYPPDDETLEKIVDFLQLSEEERGTFYYLAAKERNEKGTADVSDYLMDEDRPYVLAALRKAKKQDLGSEFWEKVMNEMDETGEADDNG